jgi:putative ABC transport system permease protein
MPRLLARLRYLVRRRQLEADLAEEMESHRSMVQERLQQAGVSADEAARESRRTLGNVTLAREEAREMWMWPSLERFWQDVRFGARMLLKQPTFAATAIATLAIGIGATTTMVSVVNGELWRPLPFHDPGKLVSINSLPAGPSSFDLVSSAELERWQRAARSLEAVAASGAGGNRVLRSGKVPESIRTLEVTSNFFAVLGWSTAIGRSFEPADDARQAAVLTDGAWRRFFNGDPGVIGRTVILDERGVQIVGVLGPDRRLEFTGDPDLYYARPVRAEAAAEASSPRIWMPIARLRAASHAPGVAEELRTIERFAQGTTATTRSVRVEALDRMYTGFNWRELYFFLGASLFVLTLSCANVANLLLIRAFDRQREFAIRGALGGGRAALTRQLLAEGLWIALPGTLAGILVASWISHLLSIWMPPTYLIRGVRTSLDLRACGFALAVCGITTAVFGLVPLLFNRTDVTQALTRTSRTTTGSPAERRVRRVFVVAEIVIAFVLVFGAGLFGVSFVKLRNAPLGFDPEDRLAVGLTLSGEHFAAPENIVLFAQRVVEEVRSRPGVIRAALASTLPLAGGISATYSRPDAKPVDPGGRPSGPARAVSLDYFATLGTRIVAGREFTAADAAGAPHVAIINQNLARSLFGESDPIGRDLVIHPRGTSWLKEERATIVGVAENSKDVGIHAVEMSSVSVPLAQHPTRRLQLAVHTSIAAEAAVESVRSAVNAADPRLPLVNLSTMRQRVDNGLRSNRFNLLLLGAFAAIAIVLAAIGLYGALAYATEQRLPELALRHALGADAVGLLMLVIRQAAALGVSGVAVGLGVALILARAIGDGLYLVRGQHEGLIYGVTTTDPATFIVASLLVLFIVMAAGAVPARRAARVDPAAVLRAE